MSLNSTLAFTGNDHRSAKRCDAGSFGFRLVAQFARDDTQMSLLRRLTLSVPGSVDDNGLDAPGVALGVLLESLVIQPVHFSLPRSLPLRSSHGQQVCKKTGHRMKRTPCGVGRTTASVLSVLQANCAAVCSDKTPENTA